MKTQKTPKSQPGRKTEGGIVNLSVKEGTSLFAPHLVSVPQSRKQKGRKKENLRTNLSKKGHVVYTWFHLFLSTQSITGWCNILLGFLFLKRSIFPGIKYGGAPEISKES